MTAIRGSWVVLAAVALALACSDSGGAGGGGGPDAGGSDGPPQNRAWVRFGNLSPMLRGSTSA